MREVDDALTSLLDLHARIETDLNAKLEALTAQEGEAQRILSVCFEQRQRLDRERTGLKEAERIYREAFGSGGNANLEARATITTQMKSPAASNDQVGVPTVDSEVFPHRPVRARIGPQRFLIFDALHMLDRLSIEGITSLTKLNIRRVKDQLTSDLKLGMVSQVGNLFALTSSGMDLLERFKAYKRAHGQPFPSIDDPHNEDDRDDTETDDQAVRDVGQPVQESQEATINGSVVGYSIEDDDGRIRGRVA